MIDEDSTEDVFKIFGAVALTLFAIVMILRVSLFIFPPKTGTKNFESKPYTGWSNLNPMKMATYGQIEVEAGYDVKKKGKFKGVG